MVGAEWRYPMDQLIVDVLGAAPWVPGMIALAVVLAAFVAGYVLGRRHSK